MPNLEIITIGTELLLGEIPDTNSTYIARTLREHGIDIFRITTIGDNTKRIASAIEEALDRADIVITTGGLGPTVDDPTRQAVAKATNRDLVFDVDLWAEIVDRFAGYDRIPTENNRRQAYIPQGAIPIHNPVGTAPCFIVEIGNSCVISLPGVPREMEFILQQSIIPYLSQKYALNSQIIKVTILHTASIGESNVDALIGDLEKLSNPTVGLLATPGQVDVRVTTKAASDNEANQLSFPVLTMLKERLGEHIYGQDEETLELIICRHLNRYRLKLGVIEFGLEGKLTERLKLAQIENLYSIVLDQEPRNNEDFINKFRDIQQKNICDLWLGAGVYATKKPVANFIFNSSHLEESKTRKYGGPEEYASMWTQNLALDFLRRQLLSFRKDIG